MALGGLGLPARGELTALYKEALQSLMRRFIPNLGDLLRWIPRRDISISA